mgnify:CR=1 FL=1
MPCPREKREAAEALFIGPHGLLSTQSTGRPTPEPPCEMRTCFQRDVDRITHSKSFRRLKHKTQVFLRPEGDHYRTRLTHTLEVSQIARTIAKALRLNESLAEAIALGHDLGHTPFGHSGEAVLNRLCSEGFAHYQQSVRIVEVLEQKGQGLNLTWEVRNGILNHRTSGHPATLEGNVVRLSDKIAYINHDIDDAIRGKIMKEEDLPREYTDILGNSVHERLNIMIHDIIEHSQDKPEVAMSPEREEAMHGLRRWMFDHVYHDGIAKAEEGRAQQMIEMLYGYYMAHPEELPEESHRIMEIRNETKERAVCDYIAGMTDIYAIDRFKELFIPKAWSV